MLPKELSNGICSLNPGVDRLAFSCLMEISDKGTVKKYKFAKTVIRSRVQGVYSEVNSILDGTANAQIKRKYKDVIDCIPVMNELAQILIKKRKDRGAPDIKSSESKVICDENGICIDIKPRIQGVSEGIIEEFMLMANNSAAKVGMKKEIPFVYRVHENPPAEKIESLKTTLEALGVNPLGINEKAEAKNFAKLLEETADDPKNIIINRIVLRTMAKAKVFRTAHRSLRTCNEGIRTFHFPDKTLRRPFYPPYPDRLCFKKRCGQAEKEIRRILCQSGGSGNKDRAFRSSGGKKL